LDTIYTFKRLSMQNEIHPTSTPASGTKRGLIYKNCFVNNFLINNERREKSMTFLKIKVNINVEIIWGRLCKGKDSSKFLIISYA